ncbi:MAG TPA: hypothetical protein VF765_24140 [Polyangiaceae bacterium]
MHAGRRFGDVVPSRAADAELTWFFNDAAMEIDQPSVQGALFEDKRPGSAEALDARADALHAGRKIWERLQQIGERECSVLAALYTGECWPRTLARKLVHLAGVVEAMPSVRADYLRAHMQGRTTAANTTQWLDELAEHGPEQLDAWRAQALRACAQALAAYERVRGRTGSVVPEEER